MLHVALVGLLAGTLAVGSPDGGDAKKTPGDPPKTVAVEAEAPGILISSDAAAAPQTVRDTYAFGRSDRDSPIRFWAHYGQGTSDQIWNTAGGDANLSVAGAAPGEITARRVGVGAELGLPVGLFGFGLGAGGQLSLSQNTFSAAGTSAATVTDSDFGLQGVKVYGIARAGAVSLHGGYLFDLGDERLVDGTAITLGTSDARDAIFFGGGFDYPSRGIRLFGGVDYFLLGDDAGGASGDDILNAVLGAGIRASIFEIGAALQIQTRYSAPTVGGIGTSAGIGGSAATIAPYLRISPSGVPATIFVKGAVQDEYTEYGFAIGGSNSIKPNFGFTAGLTVGFN